MRRKNHFGRLRVRVVHGKLREKKLHKIFVFKTNGYFDFELDLKNSFETRQDANVIIYIYIMYMAYEQNCLAGGHLSFLWDEWMRVTDLIYCVTRRRRRRWTAGKGARVYYLRRRCTRVFSTAYARAPARIRTAAAAAYAQIKQISRSRTPDDDDDVPTAKHNSRRAYAYHAVIGNYREAAYLPSTYYRQSTWRVR